MKARLSSLISRANIDRCGSRHYPVLSMTMHDGLVLQSERFKKEIASRDRSQYKVVQKGQLVVGFPIDEGVLAAQEVTDRGIVSPAYDIWDIEQSLILPKYLELSLRSERAIEYYKAKLKGTTARRRSIRKDDFLSMTINVPAISQQHFILNRIKAIDGLLAKCESQSDNLDELVKSRFTEMFETAEIRRVRLADCCERITKGTTPTTIGFSFEATGVSFIKIETIDSRGELIPDKVGYISSVCHSAMKRSQLFEGDLLFSIAGAIGRCAIVPSWVLPANTNQALSIIRLKDDAPLNRFYLKEALSSSLITEMTRRATRGIAQVNLSLKDVGNFSIPIPPMKQQEQFAEFVNQVDKLRFDVQQQIVKLQIMKKSLMQEYFG